MKAIILAAGAGTRLGKYTKNMPKCMLNFQNRTLLERQVQTLRDAQITDISIVRGYQAQKITIKNVKYYTNKNFATTNMVETLFCAEQELSGKEEVLICYADIIYEAQLLKSVVDANVDIGVVVDDDYWEYWSSRTKDPTQDMESLVVDNNHITELGDTSCERSEAKYRYVGLIKFSPEGLRQMKNVYYKNRKIYFNKDESWLRSKSFRLAYMTCLLQAIINDSHTVNPIVVSRGWLEFDTVEDYENYNWWAKQNKLDRFMKVAD